MKAIMISDHAKWCALMMNGKKKVEVRKGTALYKAIKKLIDEYGYAEFYVYCTKEKWKTKPLLAGDIVIKPNADPLNEHNIRLLNGKIPFKFRCYKVEEIENEMWADYEHDEYMPRTKTCDWDMLEYKSCVDLYDIRDYLDGDTGCAIHISDLEIFNKPKELSEFFKCDGKPNYALFGSSHYELANRRIIKAPQSWCYVEAEDLIKEY